VGGGGQGKGTGGEYGGNTMHSCRRMETWDIIGTISGIGREEVKENDGGGEFNYDIL
jgi:hypothetical protein